MNQDQLIPILTLLVPDIISEIITNEGLSENDAISKFYNSQTYSTLEEESTKLWHLSPKAIYEIYKSEKAKGIPEYPEEA